MTTRAITIDPMCAADLGSVLEIDRNCFSTPWRPDAFRTELGNRNARYFVARIGTEIVGYGGIWVIAGEGHITTLAVAPEHRRAKVGERLLLELLEEALFRNAAHLTLEVRVGNYPAQSLYRKYGFRDVAVRKEYYTDNREDAIIMWASDLNSPEYRNLVRTMRLQLDPADSGSVHGG